MKALADDLKGYDTVISAYNPGWTNPNIYNETLQNYPRIVEPAKEAGVSKDPLIVDDKGNGTISVQDYAKAMVDELETPGHHKERLTIGY